MEIKSAEQNYEKLILVCRLWPAIISALNYHIQVQPKNILICKKSKVAVIRYVINYVIM